MDKRDILNMLLMDKDFQLLEDKLNDNTIFHILNVEKREITHSAFVGWLLDQNASHGMSYKPLKSMMIQAFALTTQGNDNFGNHKFIDPIVIDKLDFNSVQVETEHAINNGKRRMDILVSIAGNEDEIIPILIIEYKVEAKETNNQTVDYAKWARNSPKYLGEYEPLHLYIVPDDNDESSPAEPFVIMDYDNFDQWLRHLKNYEKTSQAEFLLKEFRSCLKKQQYMFDDYTNDLVDRISKKHEKELAELSNIRINEMDSEIRNSLRLHKKAFEKLGLNFYNKVSKGESEFIKLFKENLERGISKEKWKSNNSNGCIKIVSIDFERKLRQLDKELCNKIRLQYWMERPSRQSATIKVEITGDGAKYKSIKLKLSNSLKTCFDEDAVIVKGKETVGVVISMKVSLPGVYDIEEDNLDNVKKYEDTVVTAVNRFTTYFNEEKVLYWIENNLPKIVEQYNFVEILE
ncbi:PD-(D/E)XK nuclease family protein [Clostridium sp. DL1XJH146]